MADLNETLETAAKEGALFFIKALRNGVDLDNVGVRAQSKIAAAAVGAYTRNKATESQRQTNAIVMAKLLVDNGATIQEALPEEFLPTTLQTPQLADPATAVTTDGNN